MQIPARKEEKIGDGAREPIRETSAYALYIRALYSIVISSVLVLAYESYCRRYVPAISVSAILHALGLVSQPSQTYEPGKGFGHTLGYIGSIIMIFTLVYPVRKRSEWLSRYTTRKFWLDTHIFLGILGAVFIAFHTTFKIGGIVSVSFWSMLVVILSGIIGRVIYIQIPRGIAGNELGMDELNDRLKKFVNRIHTLVDDDSYIDNLTNRIAATEKTMGKPLYAVFSFMILDAIFFRLRLFKEKRTLFKQLEMPRKARRETAQLISSLALFKRRIALLEKSQELLEYWRPIHVTLSIVMFIFMALHVAVAFFFYVEN